jgi:hypothetical protein
MFPVTHYLKEGDALSPLLFNFVLEYAIRMVQVNQNCFKLNGTHQLLVYVDDVNILGKRIHTIQKNTEALLVGSKENGLEVNADKSKLSHNIKIDNSFFEGIKEFKYFGTTLTNQNSIQEEMNSRMKSENTCYHSVQNPLPSSLLSKN